MRLKTAIKKIPFSWRFFGLVLLAYLVLFLFKSSTFHSSLVASFSILIKVVPVFILVFVLMVLVNYYVTPQAILKYSRLTGIKKWSFAVISGILSSGPIYMWYPLLADLRAKGLDNGSVACFLYNRAIKLPLLPILLLYFNWPYVIILTLTMVIISIIQGLIINKLI